MFFISSILTLIGLATNVAQSITNSKASLTTTKTVIDAKTAKDPNVKQLANYKLQCIQRFESKKLRTFFVLVFLPLLIIAITIGVIFLLRDVFQVEIPLDSLHILVIPVLWSFIGAGRVIWLNAWGWNRETMRINNAKDIKELSKYTN